MGKIHQFSISLAVRRLGRRASAVFTPAHKPYREFESGEEINNGLLTNPEVRAHFDAAGPRGVRPKVAMGFVNSETEDICRDLGYALILPAASLHQHLDAQPNTVHLIKRAGGMVRHEEVVGSNPATPTQ
jgi:hypothetical protein